MYVSLSSKIKYTTNKKKNMKTIKKIYRIKCGEKHARMKRYFGGKIENDKRKIMNEDNRSMKYLKQNSVK